MDELPRSIQHCGEQGLVRTMELANAYAPLILAFSAAIIAYILVLNTLLTQKRNRQERRSKTFDLILHLDITRPEEMFDSLDKLPDLEKVSHRIFDNPKEKILYQDMLRYLNRLEALAIGVKEGFYNEDILNEYMGDTLVTTYRSTQKLIEGVRHYSGNPRVFIHMEAIARRWEDKRGY